MDDQDNRDFKFDLSASATITVSGEAGTVIGRAQYIDNENNYLVLYKAADGRAVKKWWTESDLQ
jgi:hypothetical protein